MSFSPTDYLPSNQADANLSPDDLRPNPEEERILRECRQESVYKRALPMGIMFGFGGLLAARSGPLMHSKFGVKPAVFGFGLIGYMWGRLSYASVCIKRVLQVPDGNLRKLYEQKFPESLERYGIEPRQDSSVYYAEIEPQKKEVSHQYFNSDIDIPSTSNWDTTPSEYQNVNTANPQDKVPPKVYTSYDDLRQQNRQQFSNRPFPGNQNQSQQRRPPESYTRPAERESLTPELPGGKKTKYGDSWDD